MGRLCFGTYAKIVQKSIKEPNGQKRVAELLLGLITDNEDVTNQEGEPFVVTDKLASDLTYGQLLSILLNKFQNNFYFQLL
ncbi:hypothetical protein [Garciella nitratireducens]|uniref:hypothetical protein n=1 Tax=Garciella nitratireducens TaxID=218205 RepID=UPI000DEA7660|nr:hypothetical protein [Garciella nitratireducens]